MKKTLIILALALAALLLVSCGNTPAATDAPATDAPVSTEAVETTAPVVDTPAANDGTVAQQFLAEFKNVGVKGGSAEELAQIVVTADWVPFMGGAMAVEPGYLNGFDGEISGFDAGAQFGPMIGAIPCIGYIFEVSDTAAIPAFIDTLKGAANMRWNICTEADEMVVESVGNYVFFMMAPLTFEE